MQSPAAPLSPRASPATLVAEVREDAREERVGRSLAEERALAERRLRPRREIHFFVWGVARQLFLSCKMGDSDLRAASDGRMCNRFVRSNHQAGKHNGNHFNLFRCP